jgi:uncharacterized protein YdiU (UPF0061 family)
VLAFDNSYARLPDRFYARLAPTPVAAPRLLKLNVALARELGLDPAALAREAGVAVLAGNTVPSAAEPIAMAYAGHQFGNFVPQLGDGRAILLGEIVAPDGMRRDVQLKGSGPTPFSRRGDGRAALGPVLREYVVAEAMAALAIPTTRALAAVATGEKVLRDGYLPGAVLTRVAASHVRVGTFQYFAARGDIEGIRALLDYVVARHYPQAREAERPARALLEAVALKQADLVARWMHVGFIHGVMNTDNMSIAGETIDYGPCAFMDAYHPATVYSSIDHMGRYAFANQPRIAQWNLARLAETLLPLLAEAEAEAVEVAEAALAAFAARFRQAYLAGLRRKIGLFEERPEDGALAEDLLQRMAEGGADYTLTFRRLAEAAASAEADREVRALFADPTAYDSWAVGWRERMAAEGGPGPARRAEMCAVNPLYIPRNHLVEAAIRAAVEHNDLGPFETLVEVSSRPFEMQAGRERHAEPPGPNEIVEQTFCGT